MTRASVSSHKWLTAIFISIACFAAIFTFASQANAQTDDFLVGTGSAGAFTASAGTTTLNTVAPVNAAVSAGATSLTIGAQRTGTAGYAAQTSIANGRLVMVIQSTNFTGTATSGNQSAINLTSDQVGRWELARISTVAGSTLNFTNPLIYSYASTGAQVVAIPEFTTFAVGGGNTLNAPAWDGSSGGILAFLANSSVTVSGSLNMVGRGFRGATRRNTTQTGCTQLDQGNNNRKGEGIVPSFFDAAGGDTSNGVGYGNKANAAGGGDCAEGGGGGGGHHGTGGNGGRTSDGNRDFGGRGGSPLTYSLYDHMVFGGGGGSGDGNSTGNGNGGAAGGTIWVRGASMAGAGTVNANGSAGSNATSSNESAGGGGAGGSVYLRFTGAVTACNASATGGNGGDGTGGSDVGDDGSPGGGGAGGKMIVQGSSVTCTTNVDNGIGGQLGDGAFDGAGPTVANDPGSIGVVTTNGSAMANPTVAITSPTNGSFQADNTPTITGTATANATVKVYVDGAFVADAIADGGGNWALVSGVLTDGAHSVYVQATKEGLWSAVTSTNNFTIDTVMPAVNISAPTEGAYTNDNTPSATFTATDTNAGTTTCATDGGAFAACSSPYTTTALTDGAHSISVRHVDLAGNTTTVVRNFVVDTTAPVVTISAPANGSTTGDNTPTLTYNVTDTNLGTTTCSLDGGAFGACSSPLPTLLDGPHSIAVRHVDLAGNPTTTTNNFTVDTTGPAAPTINTGPATYAASTSATLTFTGAEGGGTYECRIDGGAWGACTSPANYAGLGQGSHTFEVRQIDGVGNPGAIASRSWTVDTVTPSVSISAPASGSYTTDNTPDAVFSATDTNADTTTCSVDSGAFVPCSSPFAMGTLGDGVHNIAVRHQDLAGNATVVNQSFTVDTTPPVVTISAPTEGATVGDNTPDISFSATDTNAGTTTCSVNGGAYGPCSSPFTTPSLLDGPNSVSVRHTDLAGLQTTTTRNFIVDTTAPAAPVITSPVDGFVTNDTTPTISGTAEANSSLEVFADGVSIGTTTTDGSGNWTLTPVAPLSADDYELTAIATDSVGNDSAESAAVTITIDTSVPAVTITAPTEGAFVNDSTPQIDFGVVDNGSVTIECSVDGGGFVPCGPTDYTTGSLLDGAHFVTVRATDAGGNIGQAVVNFTVDTVAPAAPTIDSPLTGLVTADTTPTLSGTAEIGATVIVYQDGFAIGSTVADGSGNWSFTPGAPIAEGTYDFTATATDAAGNEGLASNTVEITIDTTAPAAPVITSPVDGFQTNDTTPTVSGTAEPNSTVRVYADGNLVGTTTANGSGNWTLDTSALAEGDYELTATSQDEAGNTSPASSIVNITIDTTAPAAPAITSPADGTVTADTTPTVSGTAEADSTVRVYADGNLVGTTTADGSGNWTLDTSALAEGDYELTATAEDEAGNVSAASSIVDITIDTTAPSAPTITSPADGTVTNDSTPTVSGTAEANSTVRVYADGNLVGTTTADGSGNWTLDTSALADGDYELTATAEDAAGNDSAASSIVDITIDTVAPSAPAITSPSDGTVTSDTTPTVSGTAEVGSTVRVYADGNLVGTTTADGSGNWTLDTSALAEGDYELTATAQDEAGNTSAASSIVDITIDTTAPAAPAITSPADGTVTNDTTPTVSGTAEANSTVRVYADGNLVGTTTADGSGNWTLDTSALAEGDYELTATAQDEAGNTSLPSSIVDITIDTTAPAAPAITSPSDGTVTNDTTPTVSGTAEANSTVRVYADGNLVGTTTADGSGNWTLDTSALAEGDYELTATAQDEAGNTSLPSSVVDITIDTTAPAAPVVSAPVDGSSTNDTTPTISGTAEPNSIVEVFVDGISIGSVPADGSGNWTITPVTPLAEGDRDITAVATDAANNPSVPSSTVTVTIDTTDPSLTIDSPGAGEEVNDNTPDIEFTATDDGPITVTCSVDGGAFLPCSSPLTIGPLTEGDHTVVVNVEDEAGNDTQQSVTFTVDTIAPETTLDSTPPVLTNSDDATFEFSSEVGATFECSVDGGAYSSCTSPLNLTGLTDGPHTIDVRATDTAGNTDATPASYSWTVDTIAPGAPTITGPADGSTTSDDTPEITGTATPGSTVTIYVDGNPVGTTTADVNGDWTFTPSTPLPEGDSEITATETDDANNESVPSPVVDLTVDTVAPNTSIVTQPSNPSNNASPTFDFSADEAVDHYECNLDGAGWSTCTDPLNLSGLTDASHTLQVRAVDLAGNTDATPASYTWTVDTTAPAAPVITAPADNSTTTDNTPTISGTAEPGSEVTIYVDGNPIGTVTANGSGNWTITSTLLADGDYEITATAEDPAGNTSPSSTITDLTIDTTPPNGNVVEQTGTGGPGVAPTFNITSDDPGATMTCSISGGPATACTSPFTPTGLGPGSYSLLVTYTDEAGNTSNRSVNFTVAATSNPNPPITPEADPLPAACFPKGITIYELKIAGSKLQIRGFARSQYVGKEVTLNFQPTKTKVIGKATVQADGSFFAVVPAPKKALRKKGTTRYRANVDGESSFWFKLDRRMGSNLATYSGGNLNVAGFLTKPLDPKSKLTVTVRTGCNDPWTKIGDVKINRGGAFKGAIPYATDSKVLFVRMYAKVRKTPKGKATLTTYSFAIPVVTGR